MSEVDQNAVSVAVQYMRQYRDRYSLDQLRQKLIETGYSKYVVSEAKNQVFKGAKTSLETPTVANISTGRKVGEFIVGFIGFCVLVVIGFGLIGLGVAILLYFYLRKKHTYIARGMLAAFIVSLVLIVAFMLFLMMMFGGF